jgi:predicted MFS family arabinose efflux permease
MTAPPTYSATHRGEVITVYAIGLFQGLSLVAFPAAAIVLTSAAGYGLPKSRYGLLFLPQVVLAIAGSLALPALADRFRLKRVLLAGLVADSVAMGLLAASYPVHADAAAYPMLLLATAALGLGFGLTLGSISTYAGAFMPGRRAVALTALNVLLGLGTALSPFLITIFTDLGGWWYLPLLAAAGLVLLTALVSGKIRSTRSYVVLPWAICAALLLAPTARSAGAGIGLFAFGGLACSGFFPMTVGYGESTFPSIVELAAGWLIAAYQLGYGLAAFGAGSLQSVLPLATVFRLTAVPVVAMAALAVIIARRQIPAGAVSIPGPMMAPPHR